MSFHKVRSNKSNTPPSRAMQYQTDELSDVESEDSRTSRMIAAPPARKSKPFPVYQKDEEELRAIARVKAGEKEERLQRMLELTGGKRNNKLWNLVNPNNLRKNANRKRRATKNKKVVRSKRGRRKIGDRSIQNFKSDEPVGRQETPPNLKQKFASNSSADEKLKVDMDHVDMTKLKAVLRDFFAFYDPVTSEDQLDKILSWTSYHGLLELNKRLKNKYGSNLILRENITTDSMRTVKSMEVSNRADVVKTVRFTKKLLAPGIVPEKTLYTAPTSFDFRKVAKEKIANIEAAKTPTEIKDSVIDFYRALAPKRLKRWERGEIRDFIGEILSWTFRFGITPLIDNLKEKYLGVKNENPANTGEDKVVAADREEWRDGEYIKKCLVRFYTVYNPGRLERPLDEIVLFIQEEGVEEFNKGLMERYHDNLFTFENEEHIAWRGELMDKLFAYFSVVDPSKITQGLIHIIYWTERQNHDIESLNLYLKKHFGCDLDTY